MIDLHDEKLKKEIALLEIERKSTKAKLYFDSFKTIAILIGAAILFWFVKQPESIINQTASKETIARERARLMLNVINENDPQKQADAFAVIRTAYGNSDNEWIMNLESRTQSQAQAIAVTDLLKEYTALRQQSKELMLRMDEEDMGTGPRSRVPGRGPVWYELNERLIATKFQMDKIRAQLSSLGVDIAKIPPPA